jgi:leucyl aminopeptidase
MTHAVLAELDPAATTIVPLTQKALADWLKGTEPANRDWVAACGFSARVGEFVRLQGKPATILYGVGDGATAWSFADLPSRLPPGPYSLAIPSDDPGTPHAREAWALGAYRFDRYRAEDTSPATVLGWPSGIDREEISRALEAVTLVRDLVNTPCNDMGPSHLAAVCEAIAARFGASCEVVVGENLLTRNFPGIHAVGRAAKDPPRLIDLRWGDPGHPKITLVGKGVCFDTGGLDLKSAALMLIMKKDMGGAAHALALAQMIMDAGLPVALRLLIPAVENAVGGDAMRPLDVIRMRSGLTVEVANTDGEGRIILADALTEAASETPDLIVDFATLTGSARTALGPDLPAVFTNDEGVWADIERLAETCREPLWRLPLHRPYGEDLRGKTADLSNVPPNKMAGAIYAALFLERFVEPHAAWVHVDTWAWNASSRPGRPEGGEGRNLKTFFNLIRERSRRPGKIP